MLSCYLNLWVSVIIISALQRKRGLKKVKLTARTRVRELGFKTRQAVLSQGCHTVPLSA